jgi:hypothetical protein
MAMAPALSLLLLLLLPSAQPYSTYWTSSPNLSGETVTVAGAGFSSATTVRLCADPACRVLQRSARAPWTSSWPHSVKFGLPTGGIVPPLWAQLCEGPCAAATAAGPPAYTVAINQPDVSWTAGIRPAAVTPGKNTVVLSHLYMKTIILARQARDRCSESTQKQTVFSQRQVTATRWGCRSLLVVRCESSGAHSCGMSTKTRPSAAARRRAARHPPQSCGWVGTQSQPTLRRASRRASICRASARDSTAARL